MNRSAVLDSRQRTTATGVYRVTVVGCGQIGSRHLQAVASLPQVAAIDVIDPRPEALALGRERVRELTDPQAAPAIRWLSSFEQARPESNLCIVATQAEGRFLLVQEAVERLRCRRFLIEKIVAQSVHEYEQLMVYATASGVSVWVNCKQRAEPLHKRIKEQLDPAEPLTASFVGGNHGLATSGVHAADLFLFLDGTRDIRSAGSTIDRILHPSKRGSRLFDLSGTLLGRSEKGSQFILSYLAGTPCPDHLSVVTSQRRWIVDRQARWAFESSAEAHWAWQPLRLDENLMISHMSQAFAADILASGDCELPTLEECFPAHRFILNELQPYFNRSLGVENDHCPVT